MNHEVLTPITEAYRNSERIRFNVPLPGWVDTDKIGINIFKTERLMHMGGIKKLLIAKSANDDETTSMPVTLGIAPDGSAYAGRVGAKEKTPAFESESEGANRSFVTQNHSWTNLKISLNLHEIESRLLKSNANLRQAESWTKPLDEIVRTGIRQAGTKHLLTLNPAQKFWALFINLSSPLIDLPRYVSMGDPQKIALQIARSVAINFLIWSIMQKGFGLLIDPKYYYRISLFPGYEIDRALILQLMARSIPLIAPIKPAAK